jgi:hypothetical protein
MSERESGGDKLGWLLLGGLVASAFWWWRSGGSRTMPGNMSQWRDRLASTLDEQGRHLGETLTTRTHAWSERLKPNGQSKRIPVEGND